MKGRKSGGIALPAPLPTVEEIGVMAAAIRAERLERLRVLNYGSNVSGTSSSNSRGVRAHRVCLVRSRGARGEG